VIDMPKSPKNHGKAWTRSDDAQFRENTPTRVMDLKLGRSEASVYGRASALGQSLRPTNQSPYNRRMGYPSGMPSASLIREPLFCMTGAS
jgi:hypothetical protein